MGIEPWDLVFDRLFKFKIRIEELRSKEYYSNDPRKLIDLLENVIDQISESVKNTPNANPIKIRRINYLLSFYHLCLDEIEQINVANIPVELLPLYSDIISNYTSDTVFVFRPSPFYTYKYYPLTKCINQSNRNQNHPEIEGNPDIAIISFPSLEKNGALLHCCIIHEIGHHLNNTFSIAKKIGPKIYELIDKKLFDSYISKYENEFRNVDEVKVERDKIKLKEEFAEVLRRWLNEIVADGIGIYLMGPAFLFSLCEFLIPQKDFEKYSDKHPFPFIRFKFMLELIDDLDFSKDLSNYNEVQNRINLYKKISRFSFKSQQNPSMDLIRNEILESAITELFAITKKQLPSYLNCTTKPYKIDDITKAIESFKLLIPANEILLPGKRASRPIDAISILNAAWIIRLNFIEDLYSILPDLEKAEVRNILDRLVLKSVDLQEFHKRMVEQK